MTTRAAWRGAGPRAQEAPRLQRLEKAGLLCPAASAGSRALLAPGFRPRFVVVCEGGNRKLSAVCTAFLPVLLCPPWGRPAVSTACRVPPGSGRVPHWWVRCFT